ncbi:polysaccharide lyase 8 family protein [Streptomyces sp. NPDC047981]|uniref:polysaccharide lyase 8 family protein n=1 Tax=Streptomyces sp. NPDC047981 TaxID=3154610 RepID=UPI00341A50CF
MTTPSWSRRSFLSTVAGTALAAGVLGTTPALAADAYDTIRLKWRELLLGTGISASDPLFSGRLSDLGTQAASFRSSMAPSASSLWPDLPYSSPAGDPVTGSYNRLRTMALAHAQPGTGLTGNASLAADIVAGLQHVHDGVYNASFTLPNLNWWWNAQIGAPTYLLETCAVMYDHLSATQITQFCAAVDHFVPDSQLDIGAPHSDSANRVDFCKTIALRGILGKNSAKIATARDGLSPALPLVTSGDGFYRDGSYVFHSYHPYAASYGNAFLGGIAYLCALLDGSAWEITDPNKQLVFDAVEQSFSPFVYSGVIMDSVSGRACSRELTGVDASRSGGDHARGQGIMASISTLAMGASAAERARWHGLIKGWLQRDYYVPLQDTVLSVPSLSRLNAIRNDSAVTAVAEPVGNRVFGSMDRAVHRRPTWAACLSMSSTRIAFYAFGNQENKRGWHTGSGMISWWRDVTLGQYTDAFWPTVDPYRMPGTTVSKKTLADGAGGDFGAPRPTSTWAGGTSDGTYGALGMDVRGLQSTLTGRKSWFFFDDAIVCLGAGIGCADGAGVETIVENRNLGPTGGHSLTVDGVGMPTTLGWSATLTGARWAHLAAFGGYVFPGGSTVKALRQERTGAWRDINANGSTTPLTRRYVTMWLDHGTDPSAAAYTYLMMPGADSTTTAARAADTTWLSLLANSSAQQGIRVPSLGFTAVNFYSAGTVGTLTSTGAASVMVRENGTTATILVSNPTQTVGSLDITVNRAVTAVVSKDPTVTVLSTGSSLQLRVNTAGQAGATQRITVTLG